MLLRPYTLPHLIALRMRDASAPSPVFGSLRLRGLGPACLARVAAWPITPKAAKGVEAARAG